MLAGSEWGKWEFWIERNPLDDTTTVTVSLEADHGQNVYGEKAVVVARCKSHQTDLYIVWGYYLGSDVGDRKMLDIRLGKDPGVATARWGLSVDGTATFARDAIKWLRRMAVHDSIVVEVVPYLANPITAIFDIRGLPRALEPLTEACNWKL